MWKIPEENRISLNEGETPAPLMHFSWLERLFAEAVFWIHVPNFIDNFLKITGGPRWRKFVPCLSILRFPVTGEYIIILHFWGNLWTVLDRKRLRVK